MKTAFQLKADFESHQRQKDLEDELFRRTTEMREEIDLNNNMVCIDLGVHSLNLFVHILLFFDQIQIHGSGVARMIF